MIMVSYRSEGEQNLVNWSFTMDLIGVEYVQMDLMIMLEILHVDSWDSEDPVMSILMASMLTSIVYVI